MQGKILAVMQPYLFPYVGYFSLLHSATDFVFYDDVAYIKQGWINRNRILVNGEPKLFSVPLINGSSNVLIKDVVISDSTNFRRKFFKSLEQSYSKAKFFSRGMEYVTNVLSSEEKSLSAIAIKSVNLASEIIGVRTRQYRSSKDFPQSRGVGRGDRLISICEALHCGAYINPVNGRDLYSKDFFSNRGVKLQFCQNVTMSYSQLNTDKFFSNLSIIDLLMNLPKEDILAAVQNYEVS